MRNFLVPHSMQMDLVAGRPFFMVMASMSLDAVLALHFMQKISTASDGVVMVGTPGEGMTAAIVPHRLGFSSRRWPGARILMTPAPYDGVGRADTMVSPLRVVRPTNRRLPAVD